LSIGVCLGLCTQIHFSALVFSIGIAGAVLLSRDGDARAKGKVLGGIATGFILLLLPYLLWSVYQPSRETMSAGGWLGLVAPLKQFHFPYAASSLKRIFFGNAIASMGLVAIFFVRRIPFRGHRFLAISFIASIFLIPWVLKEPSFGRYVVPFAILMIVAMAEAIETLSSKVPRWAATPAVSGVVIALLLVVTFGSSVGSFVKAGQVLDPEVPEMKEILRVVIERTGWTYETFRERTIFFDLDRETDLSIVFEDQRKRAGDSEANQLVAGVVIARLSHGGSALDSHESFARLILERRDLVRELSLAFKTDSITCMDVRTTENYGICFYGLTDPTSVVRWNNIGNPYVKPVLEFEPRTNSKSGVIEVGPYEAIYYVTECDSVDPSCFVSMRLKLDGGLARFTILGAPLGVPDPSANPAWALSVGVVELQFECSGRQSSQFLASRLGVERKRATFLTPF
ncbi:MAG: hypothetical protein V4760_06730, partial [Bdellovibrionota bacterium]